MGGEGKAFLAGFSFFLNIQAGRKRGGKCGGVSPPLQRIISVRADSCR